MNEMGQWMHLPVIPVVSGCVALGLLCLARSLFSAHTRYKERFTAASAIVLLATILAVTAGVITATLLADADRESWARTGLNACGVPTSEVEAVISASGAPVPIAQDSWATFSSDSDSGRVITYGTGPLARQACDSGDVSGR